MTARDRDHLRARDHAADVRRGALDLSSFIEIEDDAHLLVCTLGFDEALDLTMRHREPG